MQPPAPPTPYQRLLSAWTDYNTATSTEKQIQHQMEMVQILKNEKLGFHTSDADALQLLAKEVSEKFNTESKLVKRIAKLASRLREFSWVNLPDELMLHALQFVPPQHRNGWNRSCRTWAGEAARDRSRFVNEPNAPIPLDRLPLLLAQCGQTVTHLDFSRLLTQADRKRLDGAQLEQMVRACPNLQSLTLLEVNQVRAAQMGHIVTLVPRLTHLNVVCCIGMMHLESLQEIRESHPQLAIGFIPYGDQLHVQALLDNGVRLRHYFAIDPEIRIYMTRKLKKIGELSRWGFPFEFLCQLPQDKRAFFVKNSKRIDRLFAIKGFFHELASRSLDEIALIMDKHDAIATLTYAGLNFIHFCQTTFKTKQMLLEENVCKALKKLLQYNIELEKFLALSDPLRELVVEKQSEVVDLLYAGFTWEQFVGMEWQQRLTFLEHSSACTTFKKYIPKLLQLEPQLVRMLLRHQLPLATLLSVNMDFETFCALPKADRERAIANNLSYTVFLMGGEKIETLVRLTDEELNYFFPNHIESLHMHGRKGISLARFVELEGALRQKVMNNSTAIGEKIKTGRLNFEEFLKMSENEQDGILN